MNTSLGYCVQFDPFQGRRSNENKDIGLGASVILNLSSPSCQSFQMVTSTISILTTFLLACL